MTTTMPAIEVRGPALTPYPYGLLSVVAPTIPDDDTHSSSGVWWQSVAVGPVGITYGPCNVDSPDPVDALASNVECGIQQSRATFTVYAYSDEAVAGLDLPAKFDRAAALLAAGEQNAVEAQLWALLAADATAGTAGVGVPAAIGQAEQAAAEAYGGTAVLHMSRYNAARVGGDYLSASGSKLRTLLGADVVAGGGYGADNVLYVTGPIVMTRGPISNLGKHIDRATNSISAVVERTYSIGWDAFAISVAIS